MLSRPSSRTFLMTFSTKLEILFCILSSDSTLSSLERSYELAQILVHFRFYWVHTLIENRATIIEYLVSILTFANVCSQGSSGLFLASECTAVKSLLGLFSNLPKFLSMTRSSMTRRFESPTMAVPVSKARLRLEL